MNNVITLRSVYGKVGQKYFIQPCPNPRTGRFPDHVKTVDSNGDMILSATDKEQMSRGERHFIKITEIFNIEDGFQLDLDDVVDASIWEAIKNSDIIAHHRSQRDKNGNLIIDGNKTQYGKAELYVEKEGELTKARVDRKKLIFTAMSHIYEDNEAGRVKIARVLGRDMRIAPPADVLEYLSDVAEKDPHKIIDIYTGDDWKMELFILDSIDRGVITKSDGLYRYGDKMLGGSIESVKTLFKDIKFKSLYNSIKRDTYPEYWTQDEVDEIKKSQMEGIPHAEEDSKIIRKPATKK